MTSLQGLRLLVAENDPLIALDLARMLEGFGVEVVGPVSDIRDALALARRVPLDGALLDVALDGGAVYPVIDVLEEREVRVVLSTGYAAEALQERVRALPRLSKPFNDRKLARLLLGVFGRSAGRVPAKTHAPIEPQMEVAHAAGQ